MSLILNVARAACGTRHDGCTIFARNAVSLCWFATIWIAGDTIFDKGESASTGRPILALSRGFAGRATTTTSLRWAKAGRRSCTRRGWAQQLGMNELYIKDEGQNPTQSFKARGMAAAVSMAKELGATETGRAIGGKRGRRSGRLRRARRTRVAHLHAERYAARERGRV